MSASSRSGDAAWRDAYSRRERQDALVWSGLATLSMATWAAADAVLKTRVASPFAGLRLADVALGVGIFIALRAARDVRWIRWLATTKLATTGSALAVALPSAGDVYWSYLLVLSVVFLGAAALLTLPLRYLAAGCGAAALALAVAALGLPAQRTAAELLGGFAYLTGCAAICLAVVGLRRRTERARFDGARALEQRNTELERALVALENAHQDVISAERHAAVGKLIWRVAHEVNNPLNVIANNLEPIEAYLTTLRRQLDAYREAEPLLPDGGRALRAEREKNEVEFATEDVQAAIREVCEAAERIAGTYVGLVEFSKLPPSVRGDVGVSQSLKTTFDMLRRALPSTLTIDARCDSLPAISVRHDDLGRALVHVLQNTSSVMHDRGTIRVRSAIRRGVVELRVEHLEQAAAARVAELVQAGTADGELGLTASRDIIQQYGGSVELDPTSARGAKLVIRVPILSQRPAAA